VSKYTDSNLSDWKRAQEIGNSWSTTFPTNVALGAAPRKNIGQRLLTFVLAPLVLALFLLEEVAALGERRISSRSVRQQSTDRGTGPAKTDLGAVRAKCDAAPMSVVDGGGKARHPAPATAEMSRTAVRNLPQPKGIFALLFCDRVWTDDERAERGRAFTAERAAETRVPAGQRPATAPVADLSRIIHPGPEACAATHARLSHRREVCDNAINPIRQELAKGQPVPSEAYLALVAHSSFIPPAQRENFVRGLVCFLREEDQKAFAILSRTLAPVLRRVLELDGLLDQSRHPTSLKALLTTSTPWEASLSRALPDGYVTEAAELYVGPPLAGATAHTRQSQQTYASWFALHLAMLPILSHWDEAERSYFQAILPRKIRQRSGTE